MSDLPLEHPALRQTIVDFVEAINRGDMAAFGALFTPDADFVVITGRYLRGRSEIVAYHSDVFGGGLGSSHLDVLSISERFLRPDVALVRARTRRTESHGEEIRTSFPVFVLVKQGESWLITAVQNTVTGGAPVQRVGAAT